jgi:hypothetical protein
VQIGALEAGVSERGAAQVRVAQPRALEVGALEVAVPEIGVGAGGALEVAVFSGGHDGLELTEFWVHSIGLSGEQVRFCPLPVTAPAVTTRNCPGQQAQRASSPSSSGVVALTTSGSER